MIRADIVMIRGNEGLNEIAAAPFQGANNGHENRLDRRSPGAVSAGGFLGSMV